MVLHARCAVEAIITMHLLKKFMRFLKGVVKSLSFTAANTLQNASEPVEVVLQAHTIPLALLMKALSSHSQNYTRMGFNAHL